MTNTYDDEPEEGDIKMVKVDALVILQIMKHCRHQAPMHVTGQLLGIDVDDTLQVTHSFGYVNKGNGEEENRTADQGEQYQIEMLRALREVNVDSNTVGWYQTTHLGQFFNDTVIEMQYLYQLQIPRSVLVVYDPLQSAVGKSPFKAFQLTAGFMLKHKESKEFNSMALVDFPSSEMFKEIPIHIHYPLLIETFLVDWALSDPISTTTQLESLDIENQAFLEKNIQLLLGSMFDLDQEQTKLANYERQAVKGQQKGRERYNRAQQPRPVDTMIISQQIKNYCKQVNSFSGDAFGKLFLVKNQPFGQSGLAK